MKSSFFSLLTLKLSCSQIIGSQIILNESTHPNKDFSSSNNIIYFYNMVIIR